MTYSEVLAEVNKFFAGKKAVGNKKHFVTEVEITDGGSGVFYIEFDGENINVEDKSHPKKDLRIIADTDTFKKVAIDGTLPATDAFTKGKLKLGHGILDVPKATTFANILNMVK